MKYLDYPELEALSRALTFESAECKVFTRLEAYSCKAVNKEKRLFKALESAYLQTASTSPPDYLEEVLASPFGRLDQAGARKTLFLLIALLNGAFPDHDFSQVNPSDFRKEPNAESVLHSLSSTLFSLRDNNGGLRSYSTFSGSFDQHVQGYLQASTSMPNSRDAPRPFTGFGGATHAGLASLLDDIMDVGDCEVFTFHPDADSDPHACVEPEEEGMGFDEEGDYWSDDGDVSMQSVNVVTPRRGSTDVDTPMFDEDFDGGFRGGNNRPWTSSATDDSDGPQTPRTPTSTAARAGDFFSAGQSGKMRHSTRERNDFLPSTSASSGGSMDMDEDEADDGAGGLLWSTYAFFYNRRLKRILFVTVWSRTNTGGGVWSSPLTSFEPTLSLPPALKLPSSVTSPKLRPTQPQKVTSNKGNPGGTKVSPAKVAIEKTNRGRTSGIGSGNAASSLRQRRAASGSPAPSSLSPFPHASPRATSKQGESSQDTVTGNAPASGTMHRSRGPGCQPRNSSVEDPSRASLDAAALSISAPVATRGSTATAAAAAASKRTAGGEGTRTPTSTDSSVKRTRRQLQTQT